MPSTYTVNLGIEKPATGEQSGTWGDTTNTNFDILDQAINGAVRVTLTSAGTSGSPNQLQITNGAASDGRNKWIEIYSASDLGGSAYVQLDPNDAEKILFIRNSLAGSQSVLLFQGTYDAARDLEVPAGVDMVVKFDGGGASAATVTDVYTKLRVTELVAPTADIDGGTIDGAVIGGTTAAAITGTTITANTSLNIAGDGATVTGIKDEDDMSSNSPTKLATQQSIKAYVDSQVGTVDTLAEILANGNTTGGTDLAVSAGDDITFTDTSKAKFGASSDLEIFHNGTHSYIIDNGTGSLIIRAAASTIFQGATAGETQLILTENGSVAAYYDDAVKLATTSAGIDVTGTASIDMGASTGTGLLVDSDNDSAVVGPHLKLNSGRANTAAYNFLTISNSAGNKLVFDGRGGLVVTPSANGTAVFNEDGIDADFRVESDNNSNMFFVDAAIDSVGIGTGSPSSTFALDVAGAIRSQGTAPGLTLYESDASNQQWIVGSYAGTLALRDVTGTTYPFQITTGAPTNSILIQSSEVTVNDNSADQDFRVESDGQANMLFVEAQSDRIGIAESAPESQLHIKQTADIGTGNTMGLMIESGTSTQRYMLQTGRTGVSNAYFNLRDVSNSRDIWSVLDTDGTFQGHTPFEWNNAAVFNETSQDYDFRVESAGNENMLFVDASMNAVGIGHNSPLVPLHVKSTGSGEIVRIESTNADASQGPILALYRNSPSPADSDGIGRINFLGEDSAGNQTTYNYITATITDVSNGTEDSKISIGVLAEGAARSAFYLDGGTGAVFNEDGIAAGDFRVESNSNTHMLFVDSGNSRIGIKNSSPQDTFDVEGTIVAGTSATGGGTAFAQNYGGNGPVYTGDYLGNLSSEYASGDFGIGYGMRPASSLTEFQDASTYFSLYDNFSGGKSFLKIGQNQFDFQTTTSDGQDTVGTGLTTHNLAYFSRSSIIFNENSKDIDFRVESDTNTHAFFVQGSGGKFGFNDSSLHSTVDINAGNGTPGDSVNGVSIKSGSGNLVDKLNLGASTSGFAFINAVKPGTNNIPLKIQSLGGGTVFNENSNSLNDLRVESDGNTHMLFVDASANMVGIGESSPTSTLVVGSQSVRSGLQLNGGPNGNAQMVEMVDGKAGTFSSVTIDVQLPGAGGYVYEVQVGSTYGAGGYQAGGGYTNGTSNFSTNTNAGGGWTVSSPSNNLIRFSTTNIGTHPVVRIKVVGSLTAGGPDMDDVTITFTA